MELFLFILLFRDLSAVQSQSVPAVLAQLSHVDSPADAAGQLGQRPVGPGVILIKLKAALITEGKVQTLE